MAGQTPAGRPADSFVSNPLTRTLLAVVLAWALPGMGHVLLGRAARGAVFGAIVWGFFGLGLAHDGRFALIDERQPFLTKLQVVANLGVGPVEVVARSAIYGKPVYAMASSSSRNRGRSARPTEIFRERAGSAVSIYGTAYLWTAGLMNLLLLFDVWDIGLKRKP